MSNKKITKTLLLGIGIGLVISSIIMFFTEKSINKNNVIEIEVEARKLGMHYNSECTSLIKID